MLNVTYFVNKKIVFLLPPISILYYLLHKINGKIYATIIIYINYNFNIVATGRTTQSIKIISGFLIRKPFLL